MKPVQAQEMVFEGVIIPVAWGSSGEIEDIGLETFDEAEYRIVPGAARDQLSTDYLRKRVRITAITRGRRLLEVKRFEGL